MGYQVEIDKEICISSGKCVADYPSAFAFDQDELAEPLPGARDLSDADLLAAARNCPSGAFTLRGEDGSEIEVD
jgi:ferredoxin